MKLHTVFITYNRLELTKQAIESYLKTVTVPYTYLVIDNCSQDGTKEWLNSFEHPYEFLTRNRYPGYATNEGWTRAPSDATHFQRADNDFAFLDGWCEEVQRLFENSRLGQVGLRTDEEEMFQKANVGGNCIIRRELWDKGLRWDERSWPELRKSYGDGYTEDSIMGRQVRRYGWRWSRVQRPCIQNLASGDWADRYYQESYGIRGIRPHPEDPTVPADWTGGFR